MAPENSDLQRAFGTKLEVNLLQPFQLFGISAGTNSIASVDSRPLISERPYPVLAVGPAASPPSGHAISYGYFPGFQYLMNGWNTPREPRTNLWSNWNPKLRQLAIAPARLAGIERPVEFLPDNIEIEPCRLNGPDGIAIVLLNWSGMIVKNLTMTVRGAAPFTKVTSVRCGELQATVLFTGNVKVSFGLEDVDIILLERP